MLTRKDALTNEDFVATRITQRFAKVENRIRYYNQIANSIRHQKSTLDKPLHRNYLILKKLLLNKKEASFHREFLKGMGFEFGVFTHAEHLDGKQYFALYKFLIVNLDSNNVKFIKND